MWHSEAGITGANHLVETRIGRGDEMKKAVPTIAPWVFLTVLVTGLAGCSGSGSSSTPTIMPLNAPVAVAPARPPVPVDPWPRDVTLSNADALIYQPQIDSWQSNQLAWRVAAALRPTGAKD